MSACGGTKLCICLCIYSPLFPSFISIQSPDDLEMMLFTTHQIALDDGWRLAVWEWVYVWLFSPLGSMLSQLLPVWSLSMWVLFWFSPTYQKHENGWTGYTKYPFRCEWMCRWWTGVSSMVWYCLPPSVQGTHYGYTMLTRVNQLPKMSDRINES